MLTVEQDIQLLIEDCKVNSRKAQEQLYRQYYSFAMTMALRYSRDEHDAADIVTTAFVKIFKNIHSYDPQKGSLHAWIKRIVINEGLNHIKARSRFSKNVELETVDEPAINNQVLEEMGADEIMQLVRKLPPATHAVFVLYAVDGYNHREIAEKLNISDGTSKWHLSEARKFLQKRISALNKE